MRLLDVRRAEARPFVVRLGRGGDDNTHNNTNICSNGFYNHINNNTHNSDDTYEMLLLLQLLLPIPLVVISIS